ncbi:MAG: RelA/SpoT family protein [Bacillales bacterium]
MLEEKKEKILLPNGGYPMHTFEDVKFLYYSYIKNDNDRNNIKKSYEFASLKHKGVFRKSGEPYEQHVIEVAYICAQLQAGPVTIQAAFLHDVVEDTDTTIEDIEEMFGEDCAKIVDSLTKIQRLKLSRLTQEEFEAEDHRKIFLGMAKDVRVIIIKLADRLHNLRTIDALSPERQLALANETLEVFAPISHRLGIYKVESELEDLSLKILKPSFYQEITLLLNKRVKERTKSLNNFKKKLADIAFNANIPFEIEARVKSKYSIYKKIYNKGRSFNEIFDILALRIITDTVLHCYELLGLIHQEYKPIPGRFKDYIAVPKQNMYQSLHTSIITGDGNIFEVQIRTTEMDEIAERGVAAHWRYKEGENYDPRQEQKNIEEKLHWFRDFVSISKENSNSDAKEYLDNLSKDIFETNIFVFTPKGKVINLPAGSTPVDMAYKIHTKVGDSAIGATINGIFVPLNTELHTGDLVEIKTSKTSAGPNQDWLDFVKTSIAKTHIKKFLQKKLDDNDKEYYIENGKNLFKQVLLERNYENVNDYIKLLDNKNVLTNFRSSTINDLFYNIAQKNPSAGSVCDYIGCRRRNDNKIQLTKKTNIDTSTSPVYIDNIDGIKINLGNCCSPVPGDEIVGYITKGMGVTVHRKNCNNIKNLDKRLIDVYWKENASNKDYPLKITIICKDRPNLVSDIMNVFAVSKINITEFNAKLHPENLTTTIEVEVYLNNIENYRKLKQSLKNINDIIDVKRANR